MSGDLRKMGMPAQCSQPLHRLLSCALAVALLLTACAARNGEAPAPAPASAASAQAPAPAADRFSDESTSPLDAALAEDEGPGARNATAQVADPLEPLNRAFFVFNDKLYFWALKPLAQGYTFVTPEPLRAGVHNAFTNLRFPVRFASNLLQGKFTAAGKETGSFVLNTTLGLGGLLDLAKNHESLKTPREDLGQTFAVWGSGHGPYLVLPVLGPSSARDAAGVAGASFLDPLTYLTPWEHAAAIKAGDMLNETALHLGEYEALKGAALDPYVAVRDAYVQRRAKEVDR